MDLENHDSRVGLETDVKAAFSSSVLSKFVFVKSNVTRQWKRTKIQPCLLVVGKDIAFFLLGLPMFQRERERSSIPSFSLTTTQLTKMSEGGVKTRGKGCESLFDHPTSTSDGEYSSSKWQS